MTFTGEHYRIAGLEGGPKPIQRPHPPILIGGGARILALAAREANIVSINQRSFREGGLNRAEHRRGVQSRKR